MGIVQRIVVHQARKQLPQVAQRGRGLRRQRHVRRLQQPVVPTARRGVLRLRPRPAGSTYRRAPLPAVLPLTRHRPHPHQNPQQSPTRPLRRVQYCKNPRTHAGVQPRG